MRRSAPPRATRGREAVSGCDFYDPSCDERAASRILVPMKRFERGDRSAMAELIVAFEAELQQLALAAAREILKQELDRRSRAATSARAAPATAKTRAPAPAPARSTPAPRPSVRKRTPAPEANQHEQLTLAPPQPEAATEQLTLSLPQSAPAAAPESSAEPRTDEPSAAVVRDPAAVAPEPPPMRTKVRGRVSWSREGIIHELASWMSKRTTIDARFLRRYGPRGLVAATRREFGRFEAALNVVNLHMAKQNQSNPPDQG